MGHHLHFRMQRADVLGLLLAGQLVEKRALDGELAPAKTVPGSLMRMVNLLAGD